LLDQGRHSVCDRIAGAGTVARLQLAIRKCGLQVAKQLCAIVAQQYGAAPFIVDCCQEAAWVGK
jgi:hypothetical protein